MPNFWTNTYGLGGDPYATLRLTAQGSRMGIPLSGAGVEMQEIKLLNKFEAGQTGESRRFCGQNTKKRAERSTLQKTRRAGGSEVLRRSSRRKRNGGRKCEAATSPNPVKTSR